MPQYTFFCDKCILQFKRRLSLGEHPEHSCPDCKKPAARKLAGQPLSHSFSPSVGTPSANSGVSQHDYPTADNIVGRSAEMRWAEQHRKNAAKSQIRDKGVALARKEIVSDKERVVEYQALDKSRYEARKKLESKFREEGKKRGLAPAIPTKS